MNILLIGSGGREHALAWKIVQSPLCDTLWCSPGNAGIADVCERVSLNSADHAAVIAFCREKAVGLVVVGPEQPLVEGLVDALTAAGIKAFGPSAKAAQLEGSKGFTKDLCKRAGIPTAAYERFTDAGAAKTYAATRGLPIVIKADGLAAGKGVIIAETRADANAAIDDMFSGSFGAAGAEVVIEDFLTGEEASFFALVDGRTALPLASAQDHKRVGDGDTGPNTGGMGAYSPAPVLTPELEAQVMREIVQPTVDAMAADGIPYVGVLYAGLMLTETGPQLIEYNARFGDPECQVLMLRMKSDIVPLLLAAVDGALEYVSIQWHDAPALTLVMAAEGYPGTPRKGTVIEGVETAAGEGVVIFHAGTARDAEGRLIANGGRVLNVTATGRTVREARDRAYAAAEKIRWPEGFYRSDIGWRAIAREG
ncbi:phosphoribosylamine--glycine ligase [Sphingosinicella microcystinivorans]|uniref:phosphoribosylamine--glycine ligase n=1 Tax=Sphingosinicella microcystinivorans TaxID=335406 RepID=UPI0022F3D767|nr:phosphoribosylamine--glycine ligase [Sphingosinicella microcystinivorans]WBX82715.1 phosphoribosylamine--glycine ligase [Sphingosinicella microcystinivorans]